MWSFLGRGFNRLVVVLSLGSRRFAEAWLEGQRKAYREQSDL